MPLILRETEIFKSRTQETILEKSGKKIHTYFTKIVKKDEYTTYLSLINTYSTKKPYFMYYVITERDNVEKAGYVKYFPDTPSIVLDQQNFTGKIQILDIKQKIKSESRFINGQEQKQTNTTTARIANNCTSSITIIPHNCGGDGNHPPGTKCDDGNYYSYYEVRINTTCTYQSGYENSVPVPNEFINDSSGGGGEPNDDIEVVAFEQLLNPEQKLWWDNPLNDTNKNVFITYLKLNPTDEAKESASQIISQIMFDKTRAKFNVVASLYSPMNIITSTIDATTTEGKKFNKLYDALKTSPEFKKLFIDLFDGDNSRINVKFEIADRVFEDNDSSKPEANATTSEDPVTKNLTIKISKQLLIAGTTRSQNNIENVKTILHECIHAYLFSKAANPAAGFTFVETLNIKYPTANEQHNFMYDKMIPTMQKVLGEVRDLVTTESRRNYVSDLKVYKKEDKSAFEVWNWNNYYKSISLKGLEETSSYKVDYLALTASDALFFISNYINLGITWLDKN